MSTFVLVHGAWHGGWCWRFVAPALRKLGHDVYTLSLTGLGDRRHLARPEINLDLHVQDVVAVLEMEDLHQIVLVGHSYGGMVITGVVDKCAERIRQLVYLDAFVPENGKCALDYILPERAAAFCADGEKNGSITPPPLSLWGITRSDHVDFEKPREARQPFETFNQPIRLQNQEAIHRLPKAYIYCSSPATGSFDGFAAKYRVDPAWRFFELKTGHDAMILEPEKLTSIFAELVSPDQSAC
jgi:pimeloyl-ACP methyl ester carboxylesterase